MISPLGPNGHLSRMDEGVIGVPSIETIEQHPTQSVHVQTSRRILPLLLVLFVGSGSAALIYEIVWFQLLELVIGSSAVSLAVLLGTYMGGMCLGSIALPRLVSAKQHPLRVYAMLELGIALAGIAVLLVVPWVGRVYVAGVGHGMGSILLRAVVCGVCLLPPTMLMGATLPAIARWVETTPRGISWLGFLYGGNIAGAVLGCLVAGFYLLRVRDMATATYAAMAINAIVALIGLGLAAVTPYISEISNHLSASPPACAGVTADRRQAEKSEIRDAGMAPGTWAVYVTIALSGMAALGAEVIWTRVLSLLLGATVYTFSIILAVFLVGLGIGSSAGAILARGHRPRVSLAACQAMLCVAIAWAAYAISKSLPHWPIDPSLSSKPWYTFHLDLMRSAWAVLPAALLWGASFPLALAGVAVVGQDPGRMVGSVYAANTIGAIFGAIGFSMLVIPAWGAQQAQRFLIALSGAAALAAIYAVVGLPKRRMPWLTSAASAVAAVMALAVFLAWGVPKVPHGLVAYGRYVATYRDMPSFLYVGEGMNASVAVTDTGDGVRNFHVSGKIEASSEPQDMRLQRMLGHIPALVHPRPRSVLVVGCGSGVTAGSFTVHPTVERIVICEIEPLIPRIAAKYFSEENHGVIEDPRVEVVYDDARHYILTTRETFDVITSDPIHPWVKGSATLYTQEYFDLVKRHLNPGGVVTQWVPLYESSQAVVKTEIATFFKVFPQGTVWSNDIKGEGYDIVLLGQAAATTIDVDAMQDRLDRPDHASVVQSLADVEFYSAVDMLATYAGQGPDLRPWLKDAAINRDRNLRLQYLAGMGLDSNQGARIYSDMKAYRRFPEQLFIATDQRKTALMKALDKSPSGQREEVEVDL